MAAEKRVTKAELYNDILNYLTPPTGGIPAIDHRDLTDNFVASFLLEADFGTFYDAASKGAIYFFQTKAEAIAFTTASTGERCLVLDDESDSNNTNVYEMTATPAPNQWALVGTLSGLTDAENVFVSKTGVASEDIEGLKTFTTVIPEIDGEVLYPPTTPDQIVTKEYVDQEVAAAGSSNQTVEITTNDTTPGRLFDKVSNDDGFLNISVGNPSGNEDLIIDLNEGSIDHNSLTNYVANEHINHTSIVLTTGAGLNGGGDISSSRTINVDINSETSIAEVKSNDELLIADTSTSNAIRKVAVESLVFSIETVKEKALYWFNTINTQVSDYLYDAAENVDTKQMIRIDGTSGNTYELTKANFYYIDDLTEEVSSPTIKIYKNTTDVCISAGAKTINPGDNDLTTNLDTGTTFTHGDIINIYIVSGTGTSSGSQIHGYFNWEVREV